MSQVIKNHGPEAVSIFRPRLPNQFPSLKIRGQAEAEGEKNFGLWYAPAKKLPKMAISHPIEFQTTKILKENTI